mgnify:CR=1 FL=1
MEWRSGALIYLDNIINFLFYTCWNFQVSTRENSWNYPGKCEDHFSIPCIKPHFKIYIYLIQQQRCWATLFNVALLHCISCQSSLVSLQETPGISKGSKAQKMQKREGVHTGPSKELCKIWYNKEILELKNKKQKSQSLSSMVLHILLQSQSTRHKQLVLSIITIAG